MSLLEGKLNADAGEGRGVAFVAFTMDSPPLGEYCGEGGMESGREELRSGSPYYCPV